MDTGIQISTVLDVVYPRGLLWTLNGELHPIANVIDVLPANEGFLSKKQVLHRQLTRMGVLRGLRRGRIFHF